MRTVFIYFFLLFCSAGGFAQTIIINPQTESKGIIYNFEWSVGAKINTNGWGVFGEYAKIKSIKKTIVMQAEIQELKDYREKKQTAEFAYAGPNSETPKDFFYGKQNMFYTLRFGAGIRRVLGNKSEKNGVKISVLYMGGLSLGFLKPYYLNLYYGDYNPDIYPPPILAQKYTDDNANKFLDWLSISGASGWFVGLKEIKPVPGGYVKLGLSFDWAAKDEFIKAIDVGIQVDIFYKKVPIMVLDDARREFISAYISFQFGKRMLKR